MYCPQCGASLRTRSLLDPKASGYGCENGHLFYELIAPQVGLIPTADTISPPAIANEIDVLTFWLTDARARERVPDQLAQLSRRLIEHAEGRRYGGLGDAAVDYCPQCAGVQSPIASSDPYMSLRRCDQGHELWWRGRMFHFTQDGVRITMYAEHTDAYLPRMLEYYTTDHELLAPYVHPQLRGALKTFLDGEQ